MNSLFGVRASKNLGVAYACDLEIAVVEAKERHEHKRRV